MTNTPPPSPLNINRTPSTDIPFCNLSQGDPLSIQPRGFKRALANSATFRMHQYHLPTGLYDTRETALLYFTQELGIDRQGMSPKNIVPAMGVTQLWHNYCSAIQHFSKETLGKKKGVILTTTPTYQQMLALESSLNKLHAIPLDPKDNFKLNPQTLDETITAINASKTHQVMCLKLDNPHNPTGAVLNKDDATLIGEVCKKHNGHVFEDRVYAGLEFEQSDSAYPMACVPGMRNHTFTAFSLSKVSGPALRAGIGCGSAEIVDFITSMLQIQIWSVPTFSQQAINYYLDDSFVDQRQGALAKARTEYIYRRKVFDSLLSGPGHITWENDQRKRFSRDLNALIKKTTAPINGHSLAYWLQLTSQTPLFTAELANSKPGSGFFSLLKIPMNTLKCALRKDDVLTEMFLNSPIARVLAINDEWIRVNSLDIPELNKNHHPITEKYLRCSVAHPDITPLVWGAISIKETIKASTILTAEQRNVYRQAEKRCQRDTGERSN